MCISVCPVKFCIDGSGKTVTLNHQLCIGCGECIDACSQKARTAIDDTAKAFIALENREPMIAVAAPALISSFRDNYRNLIGWLKQKGVAAVFDVSFGAELTVRSYLEYIKEASPEVVISQPCPAIVTYIEIYKPELIKMLAPADSPMLHTIKMIKKYHPEYKNHRVMVLSPCIAKRREFDDTGLADYNVTISALNEKLFKDRVNLASSAPSDFDSPPAERASLFSSPGGLMKTVLRENPLLEDRIRKIEGPHEIYPYLDDLAESIKRGAAPLLVDCLNCSKGCNGGTGTLSRDTPVDILEGDVRSRSEELKKRFGSNVFPKRAKKKINKIIDKYWEKGHYSRKYSDKSGALNLKQPTPLELQQIYRDMIKEKEEDFLNCAACGYNSCEMMAMAIFNGLNKPENCHHYKNRRIEIEKNTTASLNNQLKERIGGSEGLISGISDSLDTVYSNMDKQSSSLESSSASIGQMMSSFKSLSENFSAQSSNLQNLISKARIGETEIKTNTEAIKSITEDISSIGQMVGVIDDISQKTNLLSMNAAIEAAHAGNSGRGFAVVATEIKRLATDTAAKANQVGSSLKKIIADADSTSTSSNNTLDVILEIISNILELTDVMNKLLIDVNEMTAGSNDIMSSIRVLKTDNTTVVDSASEISSHITQLHNNLLELVALASD